MEQIYSKKFSIKQSNLVYSISYKFAVSIFFTSVCVCVCVYVCVILQAIVAVISFAEYFKKLLENLEQYEMFDILQVPPKCKIMEL